MKDFWEKLPSLGDVVSDNGCEIAGIGCEIGKSTKVFIDQAMADQKQLEQICNASPAVEAKLGESSAILYCKGNPAREAQKAIKAIGGGLVIGSVKSISSLLVPDDPHTFDQPPYLKCLESAARATPGIDARSCKYSDPHIWRLCIEFHIQLAHTDPLHLNPAVSPNIIDCRKSAISPR